MNLSILLSLSLLKVVYAYEAISSTRFADWLTCENIGGLDPNYTIPSEGRRGAPFFRLLIRDWTSTTNFSDWAPYCSRPYVDRSEIMLSTEYATIGTSSDVDEYHFNFGFFLARALKRPYLAMVMPPDESTRVGEFGRLRDQLNLYTSTDYIAYNGSSSDRAYPDYGFTPRTPSSPTNECSEAYALMLPQFPEEFQNFSRLTPPRADPVNCLLLMINLESIYNPTNPISCYRDISDFDPQNWDDLQVDYNFQKFLDGGQDTEGVLWPGRRFAINDWSKHSSQSNLTVHGYLSNQTNGRKVAEICYDGNGNVTSRCQKTDLSNDLGVQLLGRPSFRCSLEVPCVGDFACNQCGSRFTLGGETARLWPSLWGNYLLNTFVVFNTQMKNSYDALHGAAINSALDAFIIEDFFPKKDATFSISSVFAGLALAVTASSALVPGAAAGGSILSGALSFISGATTSPDDPLVAAKTYAPRVQEVYNSLVSQLNSLTNSLFAGNTTGGEKVGDIMTGNIKTGEIISGGISIADILRHGSWASSFKPTNISALEQALRIEIAARSINALWKTYSSNKMWLTFTPIPPNSSTPCANDTRGPKDMKLCRDGGVYYAYNFIEDSLPHTGHVHYPWGADKLQKLKLTTDMIMEGSAATYQAAKKLKIQNSNLEIFKVDDMMIANATLNDNSSLFTGQAVYEMAGRRAGSWTLPVCNVGIAGGIWNWDYTKTNYDWSHPPCFCGENGSETAAWAEAAGMYNGTEHQFSTYRRRCESALISPAFNWPNVKSVNIGFGKPIANPKYKSP